MKCRSIGIRGISCRIDLFYLENDLRMFSSLKIKKSLKNHLSLSADERRPTLSFFLEITFDLEGMRCSYSVTYMTRVGDYI